MNATLQSTFCGIETVSCVTGLSLHDLYNLVESGNYLWVWNVSSGVGWRRELRFWCREINHPATVLNLSLDAAIMAILPKYAQGLSYWDFRDLVRVSKSTLRALREELGVTGSERNLFIPRASLEDFFRRRWLGNIIIRNCALRFDVVPQRLKECV